MPCMSYDTNWANGSSNSEVRKLKAETDKLARIACAALTELEKVGYAEFLVLKNDELREWWEKHKEEDRKEQARLAEVERKERVKREALARLTAEEKELLGLERPKKKHKKLEPKDEDQYVVEVKWEDDYDEYQRYSQNDIEQLYDILKKATK